MRTVSAAVGDRPPGRRSLGRGTVGVAAAWACDNVTPSIECEGADEVEEVEARRRRHFTGALHAGGVTRGTRCQRGRGSRGSRFTHSPSPSQILARGGSALGSDGGTLETVRAVPWCFGVHVGASALGVGERERRGHTRARERPAARQREHGARIKRHESKEAWAWARCRA